MVEGNDSASGGPGAEFDMVKLTELERFVDRAVTENQAANLAAAVSFVRSHLKTAPGFIDAALAAQADVERETPGVPDADVERRVRLTKDNERRLCALRDRLEEHGVWT
jgi:hypothetical protein